MRGRRSISIEARIAWSHLHFLLPLHDHCNRSGYNLQHAINLLIDGDNFEAPSENLIGPLVSVDMYVCMYICMCA